jgi:hypothetical protein
MQVLIFSICLLIATFGTAQQNCQNCGVSYSRTRVLNQATNAYVKPQSEWDSRVLFYDSVVIAEQHALGIKTDANNNNTWDPYLIGYTYIDLRTKSFYRYRHFSDTAQILVATRQFGDKVEAGGWNYFSMKPRAPHKSIPLTDTVLNGTKCHRLLGLWFEKGDTSYIETLYYVSEAKWPSLVLHRTVVNGKRFSVIRWDHTAFIPRERTGYSCVEITSNNLTKEDLKVFVAWRRNAKKYPVLKPGPNYAKPGSEIFILPESGASKKPAR